MKKMLKVLLVLMTVVSIAGCSSKTTTEKATKKTKTLSGNYQVEIKVKDYGTIYAEIDADTAPITVTNFVKLSKEKFYDDLTFHRIIDGFMIQGGDPKGDGTGGSKETIKGEFSDNGVKNPLSHTRGALSMARSQDNDSASSQFFIIINADRSATGTAIKIPSKPIIDEKIMIQGIKIIICLNKFKTLDIFILPIA